MWCGGRDGKAAAQNLCSLAKYRAEVLCSCATLTFTGMAVRCETAKVRSNGTGLPSLTKNAVGQRQATTLCLSHSKIGSAAALELRSNSS